MNRLPCGRVDVWRAQLAVEPGTRLRLAKLLDAAEVERAARFRFEADRSRFMVAHGITRQILAGYLGASPTSLRFETGSHGKPRLVSDPGLHFNLSHSGDLLVIGVATERQLGIDIERVPSDEVVRTVTHLVFSSPEREVLEQADGAERRARFARFWTRKEAYIKADGRGMSYPLLRVDVSRSTDEVLLLNTDSGTWSRCPRWRVRSFAVEAGYDAAVAVEGEIWELVPHDWAEIY